MSTNKKEKILIVGGTGFIGYHLAKYLLNKNFLVTSLSTKKPKKIRKLKNIQYIYSDIQDFKKLKLINNKKFDYVVNLGGYVDHSNKKKTYDSHYVGCKNLFKLLQPDKIKKFIQIGSSLEYGGAKSPQTENKGLKPRSVYSVSKYLATQYLLKKFKEVNFPVVIIRAYQLYGPRQDINRLIPIVITKCLKDKAFNCSAGTQYRDFLYIDDFIIAIFKALKTKNISGQIFNIGYGKPVKIKEVILLIKKIIKKGKPIYDKIKLRKDESKILYPSTKKALKILKWKPKINFINGLNRTIKDYKKIL